MLGLSVVLVFSLGFAVLVIVGVVVAAVAELTGLPPHTPASDATSCSSIVGVILTCTAVTGRGMS